MTDNQKFLVGLLLGAAAGAALGILLTSDKGKEIIDDLKSAAGKAGEDAKEVLSKFEAEMEDAVEKGKEWAQDFEDKAKNFAG